MRTWRSSTRRWRRGVMGRRLRDSGEALGPTGQLCHRKAPGASRQNRQGRHRRTIRRSRGREENQDAAGRGHRARAGALSPPRSGLVQLVSKSTGAGLMNTRAGRLIGARRWLEQLAGLVIPGAPVRLARRRSLYSGALFRLPVPFSRNPSTRIQNVPRLENVTLSLSSCVEGFSIFCCVRSAITVRQYRIWACPWFPYPSPGFRFG